MHTNRSSSKPIDFTTESQKSMTYVSNLLYGVSLRQNYRGRIIYKEIQIFPEVYIYQKVGNILKIDSAMQEEEKR